MVTAFARNDDSSQLNVTVILNGNQFLANELKFIVRWRFGITTAQGQNNARAEGSLSAL